MSNKQYIVSALKEFNYYKLLGEKTFSQLTDKQLFYQVSSESNSIATIIKHLRGNLLSRWTDLLTTDGEKEWRNRDDEFENEIYTRQALKDKWDEGWSCLFNALNSISDSDLSKTIYIRKQSHTVLEAINRQLSHYAYHIGQIVFIGKMLSNKNWNSLSIPKGASNEFNQKMYSKPASEKNHTENK